MSIREIVVGVTGVNASDNPAPGIGVAKSLKSCRSFDAKVVGLAYDAMEPGIYMDWFIDKAFMIPYPVAGYKSLVERLCYIKESYGLDVVMPTLDSELPFYIQAQSVLRMHGIEVFLPTKHQLALRDKKDLPEIARRTGITAPKQAVIISTEELYSVVEQVGFPLMVKGALYSAHLANTMDEALVGFSKVVANCGYPVIVQAVVTGEEMNVIGLGDGKGGLCGAVAIKKMSTTDLGKIWSGVTVDHPKLLESATGFTSSTHWKGAFELECMVEGDQIHLIEINPRFPAWVYFATGVGVNLPAILVQQALGEPLDQPENYASGQLYVRYTDERICSMDRFRDMVTKGESL